MRFIAPSLLSANFAHLADEIQLLNNSQADWIHLDIMDGQFVPNISFGLPIVKTVRKLTSKPLDVHLMIIHPENYIKTFAVAGADILTVHYEAVIHLHRTINQIKDEGLKAGVVLNPHTPVSLLEDIIKELDLVLLMSVNPGFGGQKFIEQTYSKITKLRELALKNDHNLMIEVDGGVTLENAPKLFSAGADILVAGNTVFAADNPCRMIEKLKKGDLERG
jgi:ribulose-phosphate 3-epimerase